MSGVEDSEAGGRSYGAPYTSHHPVPSVQKYKEEKQQREARDGKPNQEEGPSRAERAKDALKFYKDYEETHKDSSQHPYPTANKNVTPQSGEDDLGSPESHVEHKEGKIEAGKDESQPHDTSQIDTGSQDVKERRKQMKDREKHSGGAEREVTDPVTHLPVKFKDFTAQDLKRTPTNEPPPGTESQTREDHSDSREYEEDQKELYNAHASLERLFPPPNFELVKRDLQDVHSKSMVAGMSIIFLSMISSTIIGSKLNVVETLGQPTTISLFILSNGIVSVLTIWTIQQWSRNKIDDVWDNNLWEAERQQGNESVHSQVAESTQWLNLLLASVWPLINPDLFTSLVDTLEDVMQASLPKVVRMVSVEDLGQGSESVRILGVRWLPAGAAAKSVSKEGHVESHDGTNKEKEKKKQMSEATGHDTTDSTSNGEAKGQEETETQEGNLAEGMEAEEGDFINMEIAFAYRARGGGKDMQSRAKNAHLYLAFYLPANIKFPVWVELHGIVGVVRLRLQLTPDPPFFSLCTLTFMGQPKLDVSCIPLTKKGLNIMDLPLISNFVQSSMDAAMAEYVAPKSLMLDLKDMLTGDDFKKDTVAHGVLVVTIKNGFDFKEGDAGLGPIKKGSADPYVSVGWAKFGKPVWSTRVILSELQPHWEETAFVLVSSEELNVNENLRVQLWDSDRTSADDDLGRIEVELKEIMRNPKSNGKMWDREDGFKSLKKDEGMPGKLQWAVGYFSKTRILDSQLKQQQDEANVDNMDQLKEKVYQESERKLREAKHDESAEVEQQKQQDLKEKQDELLVSTAPSSEYPTGILSIQIHQINGLELEKINKNRQKKNESNDEEEDGDDDDLPSSYCTVILNHQKIFRTRTKPKNSKPFFNAGCERLIRDFRAAEIHISVRDARIHEDDALLGVIYLPLARVLSKRSQVDGYFPLAGGVGYGRARISLVFRAVQLQAPREMLGWDYGTLELDTKIKAEGNLPEDLKKMTVKARTTLGKGKFTPGGGDRKAGGSNTGVGAWTSKSDKTLKLAVRKRYSSPLTLEFRNASAAATLNIKSNVAAFAVLWLKDLPDEEHRSLTLPVWRGDAERARSNAMPEPGEKVGEITVGLKFWSGLSGFHAKSASGDKNLQDVMEVLDTVAEDDDIEFDDDVDGEGGSSSSSSSSSDSDSGEDGEADKDSLAGDGKRGLKEEVKDYKRHHSQLHRKNRGLMQWKGPRTVKWMKSKIEDGQNSFTSMFKHHDRDTGIETEV